MRYLGVDPGGRRMGFAVADDVTGVATPLAVVPYEGLDQAARRIAAAAADVGAERVVVGLPTRDDGSETAAGRRSHLLAAAVRSLGLSVVLQSELLTTREAMQRSRAGGRQRNRAVDDIAAQIILEDYLGRPAPTADS